LSFLALGLASSGDIFSSTDLPFFFTSATGSVSPETFSVMGDSVESISLIFDFLKN